MHVTGTYRLQMHDGFGFADAAAIVPYLADLGVSHLYLSPILQAASGSMHGYDVIDHTRLAEGLGGVAGFENLAAQAHAHGMGIIVDVVPNHMAFVAPEYSNRPLWQVLKEGRDASTATWFDIDWKGGGGRLGLPVLGDTVEAVIERGELVFDTVTLDGGPEPVLRYHEHVYPLALGSEPPEPGTGPELIRSVLDRQHYRLAHWRDKRDVLNYRRFFEVDQLIAVRVELPEVFDATHALLLDLNHRGLIDGFRIDHPDGLADPAGYLERLRKASRRDVYIWVEKILEGSEDLPTTWPCDGTTGYDAIQAIQASLVDPADADVLTREWEAAGGQHTVEEAVEEAKRQVIQQSLAPEVERLTRRARESLPHLDPDRLRRAVVELLVAGRVYRAYVRADERLSPEARERLVEAFSGAMRQAPDLEEELRQLIPLTIPAEEDTASALDFAVRLQQTWGPVMAKGIEDTMFYRWHRLIALNEVGGDPRCLDTGSPGDLHRWSERQHRSWPRGMTTLSTHDTKRSEDVRARLLAVAGDPDSWAECSRIARERARDFGIDLPTTHLVWQTLLGVGDIAAERIEDYLIKALREAKQGTAWVDGDPDYEERVLAFTRRVRDSGPLHDAIARAVARNSEAIRATVLAAKTLALTMPGVPDVYQGCELVNIALVDPDNRRPVDYALRASLLDSLDADSPSRSGPSEADASGQGPVAHDDPRHGLPAAVSTAGLDGEKLWLTSRILRLRGRDPDLFGPQGDYQPLPSTTDHALGFVRSLNPGRIAGALGLSRARGMVSLVTRAPARLAREGGWAGHQVVLPEGMWRDLLTGRTVDGGPRPCAEILADLPVSVLVQG